MRTTVRSFLVAATVLGISASTILPAQAHAALVDISPRDGHTFSVSVKPTTVYADFGESVTISTSSIRIRNASGATVSTAASSKYLPSTDPDVTPMRVSARSKTALPKGRYALEYSVLSQDGHVVTGAIGFGVGVTTSPSRPSSVAMKTTLASQPAPKVVISRAQVGLRSIKVTMPAGTTGGTVKLTCQRVGGAAPKVSAPFSWALGKISGGTTTATGFIPTPCRYTVLVILNRPFPQYSSSWTTTTGLVIAP